MIDPSQSFSQGFQGGLSMAERANQLKENVRQFDANNQIAQQNQILRASELALSQQRFNNEQSTQEKMFALKEDEFKFNQAKNNVELDLARQKLAQQTMAIEKAKQVADATTKFNSIITKTASQYGGELPLDVFDKTVSELDPKVIEQLGTDFQSVVLNTRKSIADNNYNARSNKIWADAKNIGINPESIDFATEDINGNRTIDWNSVSEAINIAKTREQERLFSEKKALGEQKIEGYLAGVSQRTRSAEDIAAMKTSQQIITQEEKFTDNELKVLQKSIESHNKLKGSMKLKDWEKIALPVIKENEDRIKEIMEERKARNKSPLRQDGVIQTDLRTNEPVDGNTNQNPSLNKAREWLNK